MPNPPDTTGNNTHVILNSTIKSIGSETASCYNDPPGVVKGGNNNSSIYDTKTYDTYDSILDGILHDG